MKTTRIEIVVFTGTETACRSLIKNHKRGVPVTDGVGGGVIGSVAILRHDKLDGRSVVLATVDIDNVPPQPYRSIEVEGVQ
jgi:hypothetical protein